jgi:hypothetical protein
MSTFGWIVVSVGGGEIDADICENKDKEWLNNCERYGKIIIL